MGKPTGFLEWSRTHAPKRAKHERIADSQEFTLPLAPEERTRQAGRCMDCGVPFCMQGCPLGNPIPDFNEHVFRGRFKEAFLALAATNDFPEWTGRICPAPCEAACVLSVNAEPVTIEQMEKEIVERAFAEGWVQPRPPLRRTGRTVAIVGSGPAGLAAAARLNRLGHEVTVYERDDRIGGLLRYGIPDFKLEKSVIDRRLAILEAEGVRFAAGVDVGRSIGFDALRAKHDALVLAMGARRARTLDVPGAELDGVLQAMPYLEAQNRAIAAGGRFPSTLNAHGKRVVILGGGDTGSDCLGTALRQGASEVTQIELLPAPPDVRTRDNPWPHWPIVFRTSSSQEEGGTREFARRTTRLEGIGGRLTALHSIAVERDGATLKDVPGTEQSRPIDLLVLAMGFLGPETDALRQQLGVELDPRGNVRTDASFATTVPGVYAVGDTKRGASLVVWAIAEGRDAARRIHEAFAAREKAAG